MSPPAKPCAGVLGNPSDLAKKIGAAGIANLLELVCRAYVSLVSNHCISPTMSEDEISEELFKEVQVAWRSTDLAPSLIPIREKLAIGKSVGSPRGRGRPPMIDFCFRDQWVRESYFGLECKRLIEHDSTLLNEYIGNGLYRYLTGKYSTKSSEAALVGFIVAGALSGVVSEVSQRVNQERILAKMEISFPLPSFWEHYRSTHSRMDSSPISVHHLFFDFT